MLCLCRPIHLITRADFIRLLQVRDVDLSARIYACTHGARPNAPPTVFMHGLGSCMQREDEEGIWTFWNGQDLDSPLVK